MLSSRGPAYDEEGGDGGIELLKAASGININILAACVDDGSFLLHEQVGLQPRRQYLRFQTGAQNRQ